MNQFDAMFRAAKQAMINAYAPYSHFPVGCCISTPQGQLYSGCNVENASFSLTSCAETVAINQMVVAGEQQIASVLIIGQGSGDLLITPCGACRQRINEFADAHTPIHLCHTDGLQKTTTLATLLPLSFGPKNLQETP